MDWAGRKIKGGGSGRRKVSLPQKSPERIKGILVSYGGSKALHLDLDCYYSHSCRCVRPYSVKPGSSMEDTIHRSFEGGRCHHFKFNGFGF
jgi:hypothetical protein